MEREDVVRAQLAEQQRDLVPNVGEDRRDQDNGHDTDDDAQDRETGSQGLRHQRLDRETRSLAKNRNVGTATRARSHFITPGAGRR